MAAPNSHGGTPHGMLITMVDAAITHLVGMLGDCWPGWWAVFTGSLLPMVGAPTLGPTFW